MSKKTKEEKQAYNREYYQRNKEKALTKAKEYYENKDKNNLEAVEKQRIAQRAYYARTKNDPERKRVRRACIDSWYQKNKKRILQERKEWRQQMLGTLEYRFKRTIQSSKQRNISFSLSLEQFSEAASQACYYCDNKFCAPVLEGSGLDRIDSSKGYEIGNVVSCGFRCNQIKMDDLSAEEAKAAIQSILKVRYEKEIHNSNQLSSQSISNGSVHQDGEVSSDKD